MAKRVTRVKCDVRGLTRRIEQVGERAVKGISTIMRTYGELMIHDAEQNAPKDTGSLRKALQIEYSRTGVNGRLVVKIWVNSSTPYISSKINRNVTQKTVGDYAWLMEKYLRPHGAGGYKARKGTIAEGPQAGGRFLERAVKRYRMNLIKRAREMAKRATL